MQKRRVILVVLAIGILALQPAMPQSATPSPTPADSVARRVDLSSILANPLLLLFLRNDELKNPSRALLRVDDVWFQTLLSSVGSLSGVAQYKPLDAGVKVQNLFYLREVGKSDLLSLRWDEDGFNSSRLIGSFAAPQSYHLSVDDTRVFHRLQSLDNVDINLSPNTSLTRTWQRTAIDADGALAKDGKAYLYGGLSLMKTDGIQGHSFFQIHSFNCTNCHTVGFGQNLGLRTADAYIGGRTSLPWLGAVADVNVRSSTFDNQGPVYTYNLGGPFGISSMTPTSGSRDNILEYQAYLGPGSDPWRAGAHLMTVNRTNSSYSATRNAQYLSVQASGYLGPNLTLRGSYYAQNENNSIATNLSNGKRRLLLQATWKPLKAVVFDGKGGLQDVQYRIAGLNPPNAHDGWFEFRGDWRPTRQWHIWSRVRSDNVDHPFFPTDYATKTVFEAQAYYSMPDISSGVSYNSLYGSNTVNQFSQADLMGFVNARMFKRVMLNVVAGDLRLDARNDQSLFLPLPDTPAQLSPGIGAPLFLQNGLPYAAHNDYFQVSATLPVGSQKSYINIVPSYRLIDSSTNANFLPMFPVVPADSRVNIIQSIYGIRFDLPVFGPTERLGLGVEHDAWTDGTVSSRSGSFDMLTLNFLKRF